MNPLLLNITLNNYDITKLLLESGASITEIDHPDGLGLDEINIQYNVTENLKKLINQYRL